MSDNMNYSYTAGTPSVSSTVTTTAGPPYTFTAAPGCAFNYYPTTYYLFHMDMMALKASRLTWAWRFLKCVFQALFCKAVKLQANEFYQGVTK
jgi:hypothetical protein